MATTTPGIVLTQEITRLKVEAELLIEKIEESCGYIEVYYVGNDYRELHHIELNKVIHDLLKFLLEKKILLVSGPLGRIETIEDFFENKKYEELFSRVYTFECASDYFKCEVFERYLKYYFPSSIPDELRPKLIRLHRDVNNTLKKLYSRVAGEESLGGFYKPPKHRKRRATSRSRSNTTF